MLVVLKTTTCAVTFSLVFLFERQIDTFFLVFALLSAIGLVAGATARSLLRAFHGILQFLAALMALLAAMISLDYASGGVLGIDFMTIYNAEVDIPAFIQVGIGLFVMMLALTAWRKSRRQLQAMEPTSPPRSFRSPEMQLEIGEPPSNDRVRLSPARRAVNWISAQTSHPFVIGGSRRTPASPARAVSIRGRNGHRRLKENTKIRTRRSTLILRGKKPVKFIGVEEHRCPYCLETVAENDPRGVEICPVCHTYHHADCWSVTGVCQVPHANG
jgi:hypothetical protein